MCSSDLSINGRGRAYNLDETMSEIAYAYRHQFETGFLSALARNLMPVLDDFRVSGLSRLVREINDWHWAWRPAPERPPGPRDG